MKKIKFGLGFAVFVIFFGVAVLDAFRDFDILRILFWLAMGTVFLVADNLKKAR